MYSIRRSVRLTADNIKLLEEKGLHIPKRAVSVDCLSGGNNKESFDICIFKNECDLPIKRIKTSTNKETKQKTVQARFYHYLGEVGKNRKISEVNQYEFNSNNECIGAIDWRFYHPKEGKVRFSKNEQGKAKKHNFIQGAESITNKKGITIRPISIAEYLDIKRDLGRKKFVGEPWTVKQSITSDEGATDSIQECTAIGIIGKKGISLNHLNPNNPINQQPYAEGTLLTNQLKEQGNDAKVFLMGSCEHDYVSDDEFRLLENFFLKRDIQPSKYKTGDGVLYVQFEGRTMLNSKDKKNLQEGKVTPFYYQSGQHIAYKDGELKLSNPVIDSELEKGNFDSKRLISQSFRNFEQ